MNPVIEAALPSDDDRAPLLIDPRAGADVALDHQVAAAHRRPGERACVVLDDHDPDIMFSATDQPTRPVITISGPSISPQPKYPRLPSKRIRQRARIATPSEWRALGS